MAETFKTLLFASGVKGIFIGLIGVLAASKLSPRLVKRYAFSYAKAYCGIAFSTILTSNAISFLIACFK